ncbi:MAG: helix-turn-helix domain-containing protein [Acidobacteria bacterium]|nr:helix-turn-helix domain-containing protein [Acidobacteriota bacterium]
MIEEHGWTQTEAAERFRIGQSRVSDLVRGTGQDEPRWTSALSWV